ncbi:MAG: YtxH domain-containing protein [Spirosomaceae bacterium]|nr:YtxH domain-containing protein [Spirosomataceae bacterium]
MSVTNKHLATFILGAAAGVALHKYAKTEEGQELVDKIKTKGNELRDDAESTISKAPEYFESLKTEASGSMSELFAKIKEQFPEVENIISDLFNKKAEPINIDDNTKTS